MSINVQAQAHQELANSYVPAARYASEIGDDLVYTVTIGKPVAASTNGMLSAATVTTAKTLVKADLITNTVPYLYGATITLTVSASTTATFTVFGDDYLGQPMSETITITAGTTATSLRAFRWISRIVCPALAAITLSVGWTKNLGLPYVTTKILQETVNGVDQALGTLVAPVFTDPATVSTGDPRGKYLSSATFNGTNEITITALASAFINANGNGGIYGIKQYFAGS